MPHATVRSILVATDLGAGSDELVRSAAALAELSGAELHVLHALDLDSPPYGLPEDEDEIPSFPGRIERAEHALAEQVRRVVPEGVHANLRVVNYVPHRAIVEEARGVGAAMIVLGAHRGGEVAAELLGSTADRVIRTAHAPCLVLRGPLSLPLRRVGVPVDFSGPSRGALRVAGEWASRIAAGGPHPLELRVFHVASTVEVPEATRETDEELLRRLEREVEGALPGGAPAGTAVLPEVRRDPSPAGGIVELARERELDLLVMGTHGRAGLTRLLIGSVAAGIARRAPCPVLLVPPSYRVAPVAAAPGGETGARLRSTLVAVDLGEASTAAAAAEWSVRHFAPEAEHLFVHVLQVREPPAFLGGPTAAMAEEVRAARAAAEARLRGLSRGLTGTERVEIRTGRPAEEIARVAEERGVDLVVVGPHARHGLAGWLGSTAESLLGSSPAPVLLAREVPPAAPTRILAAVDESERGREVLAWARVLKERFGARLGVLYVFDLAAYQPPLEFIGHAPPPTEPSAEAHRSARDWLAERAREAGLAEGEADLRIEIGEPGDVVLEMAGREGTELIVMGSRGAGAAGRLLLGSVAGRVLRHAPCPVFVVGRSA